MKDAAFYESQSVGKIQPCNHFCCQFAVQEAFRQDVTEGLSVAVFVTEHIVLALSDATVNVQ